MHAALNVIMPLLCFTNILEAADPPPSPWQKVNDNGGLHVELGDDSDVAIRQANRSGGYVILSNVDGVLSIMQIAADGRAPVMIKLLGDDKAVITVKRGSEQSHFLPFIVDHEGDGIPDEKIDFNEDGERTRYTLESITWRASPNKPKKVEQGSGGSTPISPRVESDSSESTDLD